jgi:hypothetical protein
MARKFYTPISLTGLELTNFKIHNLDADPTAYGVGHAYYNTVGKEVRVYDGAVWQPVGGSIDYGVIADRPAFGNTGKLYASTDTKILYLDNGSAWLQIGIGTDSSDTFTNKTISGSDNTLSNIANASLTNSSIEINGVTFDLGDTGGTITAATNELLTFGANLTASDSVGIVTTWDGLAAVTVSVDETVIATRVYVDSVSQGLDIKPSVQTDSDIDVDLTAITAIAENNRILLRGQDTAAENGIYVSVDVAGDLYLQRAADAVPGTSLTEGAFTFVEGTNCGWVLADYPSTWTQFSGAGTYTAGDGIDLVGTEFSVNLDTNSGLATSGDGLTVDLDGSTLALGADGIKVNYADGLTIDLDGKLAVDTTKVVYKYATTITGTSTNGGVTGQTQWTITHSLGTEDVQVAVYDSTTKEEVITDILFVNTTTATIGFAVAPVTTQSYRVVVQA